MIFFVLISDLEGEEKMLTIITTFITAVWIVLHPLFAVAATDSVKVGTAVGD